MNESASLVVFRDSHWVDRGPALDERPPKPTAEPAAGDYWRSRERAERAAAKKAQSSAARAVHQELAQQYAERIRQLEKNPPPMPLRSR